MNVAKYTILKNYVHGTAIFFQGGSFKFQFPWTNNSYSVPVFFFFPIMLWCCFHICVSEASAFLPEAISIQRFCSTFFIQIFNFYLRNATFLGSLKFLLWDCEVIFFLFIFSIREYISNFVKVGMSFFCKMLWSAG